MQCRELESVIEEYQQQFCSRKTKQNTKKKLKKNYLQWNAANRHHGHPIIRQLVSILIVKVCVCVVDRGVPPICSIEVTIVVNPILIILNGIDLKNT
jgi:hypothetical protein